MNNINELSDSVSSSFIAVQDLRFRNGEIGRKFHSTLIKTIGLLHEYENTGAIVWKRRLSVKPPLKEFEQPYQGFIDTLTNDLSSGSIRMMALYSKQLLLHLIERKHYNFSKVGLNDIQQFLVSAGSKHRGNISNVIWVIKRFFKYLNECHISELSIEHMIGNVGPRRIKALPCLSENEVSDLLSSADLKTKCGKRDYAIISIALSTGLRCCDIIGLKFSSIDWHSDTITISQQKTGNILTLPFDGVAGNAIADYILTARPQSDEPYIFLRTCRPYTRLKNTFAGSTIIRWLKNAGISREAHDGKTFHALRRTVGTRLIESGADLSMTAQILGHIQIDSTRRYISLSEQGLRDCCLPISEFAVLRRELR